jgi:hypothetical protein
MSESYVMIPQALPIKTSDLQIVSKIQKSIFNNRKQQVILLDLTYRLMNSESKKKKKMPP